MIIPRFGYLLLEVMHVFLELEWYGLTSVCVLLIYCGWCDVVGYSMYVLYLLGKSLCLVHM